MTALAVGAAGTATVSTAAAAGAPPYLRNGKYDFDTIYSRVGSESVKWDSQIAIFGDKVKVGMGIADMDFRAAPCIAEAMMERLQHENWGYLSAESYNAYREAIADWNHDRYGYELDPASIVSMTALAGAVGAAGAATVSTAAAAGAPPYLRNGKYDFDTIYSRVGSDSVKWDSQIAIFGDKVKVGMGIADMDFRAAPCIAEAMMERLQHENWGYLSAESYNAYREAIADWNHDRYGYELDPASIVFATGVHPGLIATLKTFSPPASQVLMMTPTYNGFYSDLRHSRTIKNESEMVFENGRYSIDWDDFEARMTADTQSLLLCNPQNPTGNVWTEAELLRIGELCLKHQVFVLADEIHADFVRTGKKVHVVRLSAG